MPLRTTVFNMLPWNGGYNTTDDPSLIQSNQLTVGENIIFGERTSKKQRPAINYYWDDNTSSTSTIVGGLDYWYGSSSKTQKILSVASDFSFQNYNPTTGAHSVGTLHSASSQWVSAVTAVSFETFNNKAIWAGDGTGNLPMIWSGGSSTYANLTNAPAGSIVRAHLGRLWMNDKTNKDRLHYSETFAETVWQGAGDSGAIDIGTGDGDPDGITAIFPSFKGDLFVAKRTKLYRVSGYSPDTFSVTLVSNGIGCVSHRSIALIDQDDMFFVSERGVHSILATNTYGDFAAEFLSRDIQKTFNENWVKSKLSNCQAAYIPSINSYVLAVTDSSYSSTANKAMWCYNIVAKAWYLWPNLDCSALFPVTLSSEKTFFLGTSTKRLAQGLYDSDNDINESGTSTAVLFNIASGFVCPDSNPYIMHAFKKMGIYFTPNGAYDLTIKIQIDTQEEQSVTLQGTGGDLLDDTFILDESILQAPQVMEPAIFTVDGYGRTFKMTITQNTTNSNIEIQGFLVEYEPMGPNQETSLTGNVG